VTVCAVFFQTETPHERRKKNFTKTPTRFPRENFAEISARADSPNARKTGGRVFSDDEEKFFHAGD
jgi:hypothetical protein